MYIYADGKYWSESEIAIAIAEGNKMMTTYSLKF
jgi:hypothetical protein